VLGDETKQELCKFLSATTHFGEITNLSALIKEHLHNKPQTLNTCGTTGRI